MGWERRGSNSYYYKKERQGSRVRSVYVGRGQIAHMVAQIQSSSPLLEKFARLMKSPEQIKLERAEAALDDATDLIHSITQAALLSAGFHMHHRQWRRKRYLMRQGNQNPEKIREQFHNLLTGVNMERPRPTEVQALKDLLYNNKEMEIWKAVIGMGDLAESQGAGYDS